MYRSMRILCLSSIAGATCLVSLTEKVWCQSEQVSFAGKTITIVVGFGAGGGYDIYARLVAEYFGKFLPGKPSVVVQNSPGAASVKAAMAIYHTAPKDGTSIGLFLSALTVDSILRGTKIEAEKFTWIGRINDSATLGVAWHTAPVKTLDQAKNTELIVGSTGASGNSAMVPWAFNTLVGTKFKVIPGYRSSPALAVALESEEIQGIGAISFEYLSSRKMEWMREKKLEYLYVIDLKRKAVLPNVPAIIEFARDEGTRKVLSLLGSASAIGYSFAAPPGVSKEVADSLRSGFSAMIKDPAFLTEAEKRRLTIDPLSGDEVQQIVSEVVATPTAIVDMARRATAKPK